MSAARHAYGLPSLAAGEERTSSERSAVVPLLILVAVLAAATTWLVVLPLLDRSPQAARPCEVFVLRSGATKCVPNSAPEATTKSKPKAKPARRAKS